MKQQPVLRRAGRGQRYSAGFTLIELMVTVVVVAILASIAYPSYTDYLRRGQAQEAPRALSDFRTQMEQYYQDNRNYGSGTGCGVPAPTLNKFTWLCTNSGQGYSATATGTTGGLVQGLAYSIDQSNNQTTTCTSCAWGFSGTPAYWVLRKP
ncbi:type IV pilin protein [Variovorax sp. VaC1]|uniref:type IV pilin protein n=1 Tax=Variovorax sp. VaC1 TaxID=3373132 RepID=UPI003747AD1B